MCYSEPLSREDSGYMEPCGDVLVGWKLVMLYEYEMRPCVTVAVDYVTEQLMDLSDAQRFMYYGINGKIHHTVFPPRELLEEPPGSHGFHVASSESFVVNGPTVNAKVPRLIREGKMAICRVLVPEHAVRPDHHVDALMVMPSGEHETAEDIAVCNEWNRLHMPEPLPPMPPPICVPSGATP